MISSIANLVYEFPNDLRLRILGNKEILEISQVWVETQSSFQSPVQKSIAVEKHVKVDTKLFLPCQVLLDFSILFQKLCLGLYLQWYYN